MTAATATKSAQAGGLTQQHKDLIAEGNSLFERRRSSGLISLWQEIAENFNPIRADFTTVRQLADYAPNIMNSRPLLTQRDLANAVGYTLRPRGSTWAKIRTDNDDVNQDAAARQWLDRKSEFMRNVMYSRDAGFMRATKQGDSDFVTFGQTVISIEPNRMQDGILYRTWHIRDCVWAEDTEQRITRFHRNWTVEAHALKGLFPNSCSPKIDELLKKNERFKEIKCRHIVIPSAEIDMDIRNRAMFPFVSIYIDLDHEHVLEMVPRKRLGYVIPRWVMLPGSQYAFAPTTFASMPDARMVQQVSLTLLEAGQMAVMPPLMAKGGEVIGGGINVWDGGVTYIDPEYDGRLGRPVEAIFDGPSALPWADDREEKIEKVIQEAFFLNKLNLPEIGKDMTAYETKKRIEEYVRGALPLFEPMEIEYNGAVCEDTFALMRDMGGFGNFEDMPPILKNRDIRFEFDSPLQATANSAKAQQFMEAGNRLAIAMGLDPTTKHDFNVSKAFRDSNSDVPADWVPSEEEAAAGKEADEKAAKIAQAAQAVDHGAQVAGNIGVAAQQLQAGGIPAGGAGAI